MTNSKRGKLSPSWLGKKEQAPSSTAQEEKPVLAEMRSPRSESRKGQTLRLNREAWKELKMLGIESERPVHRLLIEAVNDLLEKYGRARVALEEPNNVTR